MSLLCWKPYDGWLFHWDKKLESLQWSTRSYIILTPLLCLIPPPLSQSMPNSPLSYFSKRQACFCLMAQHFLFLHLGLSHIVNSPTDPRPLFKYHLFNNESVPVHCIVYFNCLPCIFSLLSTLVFYIALSYYILYLFIYLYFLHCPTKM